MKIDTVRNLFGERVFTAKEARVALGRDAKVVLSRSVISGYLVRVGRGLYRVADPGVKARIDSTRFKLLRARALALPGKLALDGPDAVSAWTGGRYTVNPSAGPTIWLAVTGRDLPSVRSGLERQGWFVGTAQDWPTGRGPKAILRAVPRLATQELDGDPVISRSSVMRLIKSQPAAYEGAEDWLIES